MDVSISEPGAKKLEDKAEYNISKSTFTVDQTKLDALKLRFDKNNLNDLRELESIIITRFQEVFKAFHEDF